MCLVFEVILMLMAIKFTRGHQIEVLDPNFAGTRIINGTKAALGQFPGEISLRVINPERHICGGSIISERWVLTAAHCMFERISHKKTRERRSDEFMVVAGDIRLKRLSDIHQKKSVERIIRHQDYKVTMEGLANDVALLKIKEPFEFDDKVKPRPLINSSVKPGTVCQIAGWGAEKYDQGYGSLQLLFIEVPIVKLSDCQSWMRNYLRKLPAGTLCAGYEEGQRDACQGDSGGGLMCNGFLTGVVSWGRECAKPRSPGFYADVYYYSDWIKTAGESRKSFEFLLYLLSIVTVLFI